MMKLIDSIRELEYDGHLISCGDTVVIPKYSTHIVDDKFTQLRCGKIIRRTYKIIDENGRMIGYFRLDKDLSIDWYYIEILGGGLVVESSMEVGRNDVALVMDDEIGEAIEFLITSVTNY